MVSHVPAPVDSHRPKQCDREADDDSPVSRTSSDSASNDLALPAVSSAHPGKRLRDVTLRAVPFFRTMRRLGLVWRWRPAEESVGVRTWVYNLSEEVDSIDFFVSHTWSASGFGKCIALLGFFRRSTFFVGGLPALAIVFVLEASGILPPIGVYSTRVLDWKGDVPLGMWCASIAPWAGVLCALWMPSGASARNKEPNIFLDQVCIHQVDAEMKQKGILSLGYFLSNSQALMILWTPKYLSRLWCVYELAAYVAFREDARIVFHPVFMEVLVAVMFCAHWLLILFFPILSVTQEPSWRIMAVALVCTVMACLLVAMPFLRVLVREQDELAAQLASFDCATAECSLERDRKFIIRRINQWYGSAEEFNAAVRGELRLRITDTVQGARVKYSAAAAASFPILCYFLDFMAGLILAGVPPLGLASYALCALGCSLMVSPLTSPLLYCLADAFGHKRRSMMVEAAVNVATTVLLCVTIIVFMFTWLAAYKRHIGASAALLLIWAPITWRVFFRRSGPEARQPDIRRPNAEAASARSAEAPPSEKPADSPGQGRPS
eukprot:CAMPEP_0117486754 /NCGR_PEP_ID=MMETSP0784-20121206/15640_1 /TAXON_ID=39447 /ORGANISM="" /LENGTH=550 /DNA_ID=CAMNT_0005281375 /DNA_START=66 /DNA_END=1718 /DNA_ORIENTATION=+